MQLELEVELAPGEGGDAAARRVLGQKRKLSPSSGTVADREAGVPAGVALGEAAQASQP
jgi:hypothetical protein